MIQKIIVHELNKLNKKNYRSQKRSIEQKKGQERVSGAGRKGRDIRSGERGRRFWRSAARDIGLESFHKREGNYDENRKGI